MGNTGTTLSSLETKRIFSFSTRHLSQKDKVRFFYALNGRDHRSGIIKEYDIVHLGPQLLLVPEHNASNVAAFLAHWGCRHKQATLQVGDDI